MQKYLKGQVSFKIKVLVLVILMLVSLFLITSILFYQTNRKMKRQALTSMNYNVERIRNNIDDTISSIYNVSEVFATDSHILEYIQKEYEDDPIGKMRDMNIIENRILPGYQFLKQKERIAAIYTFKNELFNFMDNSYDGGECIESLNELNVNDRSNLSIFQWYSVRDNILTDEVSSNVRENKVVLGSRRIFSRLKEIYVSVQIFALPEESIYNEYAEIADQFNADVYILNGQGELLSSSNIESVKKGSADAELVNTILNRESNYFEWNYQNTKYIVSVSHSQINDWISVIFVPSKNITKAVDDLYFKIFMAICVCIVLCCAMLIYLYKGFMSPLALINESMKEVYNGNLDAYVEVKHDNEIGNMMAYYNAMLESINHNIKEKLLVEKRKKELEMEVLMSQVNPHFLYNTLETIVWKAREAGRPDISRTVASLGRLYRLSISNGDVIVRIQQEIEHLMAYINIQASRYEGQFKFDLRSHHESIREYYIIKLIMQPIVENSFLYGMDDIDHKLLIRLSIRVQEDVLKIIVTDNGAGMSKDRLQIIRQQINSGKVEEKESELKKKRKGSGIGLHSVKARIQLYFGLEDAVKIYSKEGMGTMTVVTIPKVQKGDLS